MDLLLGNLSIAEISINPKGKEKLRVVFNTWGSYEHYTVNFNFLDNISFTYTLPCPFNVTSFLVKNTHDDSVS
jgi:hypothetical protein